MHVLMPIVADVRDKQRAEAKKMRQMRRARKRRKVKDDQAGLFPVPICNCR